MESLVVLNPALPLAGFILTGLFVRRLDKEAHWLAVGVVVVSWLISMVVVVAALSGRLGDAGLSIKL